MLTTRKGGNRNAEFREVAGSSAVKGTGKGESKVKVKSAMPKNSTPLQYCVHECAYHKYHKYHDIDNNSRQLTQLR